MDTAEPIRSAIRRYGRAADPLEKLRALAEVQRAAPVALAEVVEECREHGNGWRAIGDVLGLGRTALYEQHRAGRFQAGPDTEEMSA